MFSAHARGQATRTQRLPDAQAVISGARYAPVFEPRLWEVLEADPGSGRLRPCHRRGKRRLPAQAV